MTTTFRAAYYLALQSTGIRLTSEDQAGLSDEALRAEAHAEALRTGLIGPDADANQITEEEFFDGLRIGEWKE